MGYSKNPATVRKIAPQLASLAEGKNCSWRTKEPDRWAYKIREALWIAARNAAKFPALAQAYNSFEISIEGDVVHAKQRSTFTAAMQGISALAIEHAVQLVLTGPRSIEEVIQFWLDAQPTQDTISVLEVQGFTNEELDLLTRWASQQTPAWELIHNPGQTFFMLRPSRSRKFTNAPSPITLAQPNRKPEEPIG